MTNQQCFDMFGVHDIQDWFYDICFSHPYREGGRRQAAFFLLSDVQEELAMGYADTARKAVNRIKYLLDSENELEYRIVASLITHLLDHNFEILGVLGDDGYSGSDPITAMKHIFDTDEASLRVHSQDGNHGREHYILLIPGNGEDIVSDWSYSSNDEDQFDAIMQRFKEPEAA